jgi:hypothetical protein
MAPGAKRGRATGRPTALRRDSRFTKREFGSFAGVLRPKARDRYADESDALGRRQDGPDQAKGDLVRPALVSMLASIDRLRGEAALLSFRATAADRAATAARQEWRQYKNPREHLPGHLALRLIGVSLALELAG